MKNAVRRSGVAKVTVLRSTRSAPIVGEHLGSFAGFLGRAYREYDYYTGIYDGLEFIARNFLCDSTTNDTCAREQHEILTKNDILKTGPLGREVLKWHWQLEYDPNPHRAAAPDSLSEDAQIADRLRLLTTIHNAMFPLRSRQFEIPCGKRLLEEQLCKTGLDKVVDAIRNDPKSILAARRLSDWCKAHQKESAAGECTVDPQFMAFLEHPVKELNRAAVRVLSNLWDAENMAKEQTGASDYSAWVEFASAYYRSTDYSYRRGLEFNPSSAMRDSRTSSAKVLTWVNYALPNELLLFGVYPGDPRKLERTSDDKRRVNTILLAWQPVVWFAGKGGSIRTRVEVFRGRFAAPSDEGVWAAAPGVTLRTYEKMPWLFTSFEIGGLYTRHIFSEVTPIGAGRRMQWTATLRGVNDRIVISYRWAKGRPYTLAFGVSDVNGLAYWILR
ncbi:MAG TPA: hypothetical protein VES88_12480 [Gemmatimonadaceae bacterium]|nr:hypothetical protein [Gemmatimonadaceae bacterium]